MLNRIDPPENPPGRTLHQVGVYCKQVQDSWRALGFTEIDIYIRCQRCSKDDNSNCKAYRQAVIRPTVNVLSELVSTLESPEYKPESLPADLMLSLQVAGNMAEDLGLDPDIKKSFDRIGSLVLPRVRILKAGAEGILNAGGE